MPLYRILNSECKLQPFRSTELGSQYQECNLEDWIEANPLVLVDDEPLLIIGRQVNTPVGIIDLLGLDSEGAAVVVDLKRAPNQREAIAQSLEYAAWISSISSQAIQQMAETYFNRNGNVSSLAQAWQQGFGDEFQEAKLNSQQRIFLVIEGDNERIASIVRYLRGSGLDISLLSYSYYRTESNEEILHIERQVGDESPALSGGGTRSLPTEESLLNTWGPEVRQVYAAFRERMTAQGLSIRPKKSGLSFYKQTRDDLVFVCFVYDSQGALSIWLRSDSLQARFDFQSVAQTVRESLPPDIRVKHTTTWFIMFLPSNKVETGRECADLILRHVVSRLE